MPKATSESSSLKPSKVRIVMCMACTVGLTILARSINTLARRVDPVVVEETPL
jgi:hypothetical protein